MSRASRMKKPSRQPAVSTRSSVDSPSGKGEGMAAGASGTGIAPGDGGTGGTSEGGGAAWARANVLASVTVMPTRAEIAILMPVLLRDRRGTPSGVPQETAGRDARMRRDRGQERPGR